MEKFEYAQAYYGNNDLREHEITDYLNRQGQLGWELIQFVERPFIDGSGIANRTFYFKRTINEPTRIEKRGC